MMKGGGGGQVGGKGAHRGWGTHTQHTHKNSRMGGVPPYVNPPATPPMVEGPVSSFVPVLNSLAFPLELSAYWEGGGKKGGVMRTEYIIKKGPLHAAGDKNAPSPAPRRYT